MTAILDHLAAERVDSVLCLGDIVGYGADPSACIEAVRERAQVVVAGNHDWAAAGLQDLESFSPYARIAVEWTSARLCDEERAYLASLPLLAEVGEATLVHASPFHPENWDYLISERDGKTALSAFETRLCFIGHSHRPVVWIATETGVCFFPCVERMTPGPRQRLLVNVGSVGQPRDRDPRAAYVMWDVGTGDITLHRVAYDVAAAQAKIMKAGLPRFLADRLANGQ